jgi:hypothetical protein
VDKVFQRSVMEALNGIDPVGVWRWRRTRSEADLLLRESLEQSLNNLITNDQQFFYAREQQGQDCLNAMLAAPRAVKVIQTIEAMTPAERDRACSRIFAEAFAKHTNAIAAAIRMWEDPSAPTNHQSLLATQEGLCVAMFMAADLGLRPLLAEQFTELERFRDTAVKTHSRIPPFTVVLHYSVPDSLFQLNILRLVASHDAGLNALVSKVVEEALSAKNVRPQQVSVVDTEIAWYTHLTVGRQDMQAPRRLKTYQFLGWDHLQYQPASQEALVQKLKSLVFSTLIP